MNRDKKNQVRLGLESLEVRETPAHLNPGVDEVVLPTAAAQGANGNETANEATENHHKAELIVLKR